MKRSALRASALSRRCRPCCASCARRGSSPSDRRAALTTIGPVYTLEDATSRFIDKLFDGAIDKYVLSMLSAENVSPDEMRDLEKIIAKARKSKQKNEEG